MRATEFADPRAVGRLLLVIEGAARHGWTILAIPPAVNLRNGEKQFLEDTPSNVTTRARERERYRIANAVRRRREASHFLRRLGFFYAAELRDHAVPVAPVWSRDESEWSPTLDDLLDAVSVRDVVRAPYDSEAILPFTWLGAEASPSSWATRVVDFLTEREIAVMTQGDALDVSTNVLAELIANVVEHAQAGGSEGQTSAAPQSLIGAVSFQRGRALWRREGNSLYPSEAAFNESMRHRSEPTVTLFVGDSGAGIPTTLAAEYARAKDVSRRRSISALDVIEFSFDPTASRHDHARPRGIGLAGVRRFARAYSGRVAIRAADAIAGYWYRGDVPVQWGDSRLAYAPGTFVEVTLGLTLTSMRLGHRVAVGVEVDPAAVVPFQWRASAGYQATLRLAAETALTTSTARHPVLVSIATAWPDSRADQVSAALAIRAVARELRGRAALAIVIPKTSKGAAESVFPTLDDVFESGGQRSDAWALADSTPAVLVVSGDGRALWTGASKPIRTILYRLLDGDVALDEARSQFKSVTEEDYLLVERDWTEAREGGRLAMKLDLASVDHAVQGLVAGVLTKFLSD